MNTWVISGCTSGLGQCWTDSIIKDRGEKVIGLTRSTKSANDLTKKYKDKFIPCVVDVRDAGAVSDALLNIFYETDSFPTRIVTAAGFAQFGTLEDLANDCIRKQFETNVEGTLNVIRPLLPLMRQSNLPSRILLVSSMSGLSCWPLLGAYQISKYAIEAISDTLAQELFDTKIQVGCIEPGPHKTGWATVYARHADVSESYDFATLKKQASCGYSIEDPEASLPFFWKMFDSATMPKRIATSQQFVDDLTTELQNKIQEWRNGFDFRE